MELATIEMPKAEARKKAAEYRRAVKERHADEDAQILRGYRELAKGHQLLRLSEAIKAGGTTVIAIRSNIGGSFDRVQVPNIAVARADLAHVYTQGIESDGDVHLTWRPERELAWRNRRERFRVREAFTPEPGCAGWRQLRAIVPIVPPALRPSTHLRNYHILFEAEWGVDPDAPVDPALLKHMGGDLYAVLATWDLTEVERAVLALRD